MGIEQAFGLGQGPAEVIVVGQKANYAPYEIRIAELEGAVRGYQKGVAELTAVAKLNKAVATRNRIVADVMIDTLHEVVARGCITREETLKIKAAIERKLPPDEFQLLTQKM